MRYMETKFFPFFPFQTVPVCRIRTTDDQSSCPLVLVRFDITRVLDFARFFFFFFLKIFPPPKGFRPGSWAKMGWCSLIDVGYFGAPRWQLARVLAGPGKAATIGRDIAPARRPFYFHPRTTFDVDYFAVFWFVFFWGFFFGPGPAPRNRVRSGFFRSSLLLGTDGYRVLSAVGLSIFGISSLLISAAVVFHSIRGTARENAGTHTTCRSVERSPRTSLAIEDSDRFRSFSVFQTTTKPNENCAETEFHLGKIRAFLFLFSLIQVRRVEQPARSGLAQRTPSGTHSDGATDTDANLVGVLASAEVADRLTRFRQRIKAHQVPSASESRRCDSARRSWRRPSCSHVMFACSIWIP